MLKTIRALFAVASIIAVSLLFLDFTGVCRGLWGWLAKIQFIPALLALNFGIVVALLIVTLVFGRIYCSVICPLGIMQDVFTHVRGWFKIGGKKRNRFNYRKGYPVVRWMIFVLFVILLVIPATHMIASFIEPYSGYGRIMSAVAVPVYDDANNLLASVAESHDSYTFYEISRSSVGIGVTIAAWLTLIIIGATAFFAGRNYCNTICPVGTLLGFVSRFSILKPWIDTSRCNGCTKCARNCKAMCIDPKNHRIDYSRCVACMDCIGNCSTGAIRYSRPVKLDTEKLQNTVVDKSRRNAMITGAMITGTMFMKAADDKITDGGLARIIEKEKPGRKKRIVPPGAVSLKNLTDHCTGCQLCIVNCPNEVLRPSTSLTTFMQPVVEYERGYCRPECTACSSVCPVGAIKLISVEEKSSISIGVAIVNRDTCVSSAYGESCGNCARHCLSGAITMVSSDPENPSSNKMPVVNEASCIGCGACENLCPVRPISAIHVEGREVHVPLTV